MSSNENVQAVGVEKDPTRFIILCEVSGMKDGKGYKNMVNLFASDETEAFIKMLTTKEAFAKNNEEAKVLGVYSKTTLAVMEGK